MCPKRKFFLFLTAQIYFEKKTSIFTLHHWVKNLDKENQTAAENNKWNGQEDQSYSPIFHASVFEKENAIWCNEEVI